MAMRWHVSQAIGYTLSKFYGIKFIYEILARRRGLAIIGLVGFAEVALLLFAVTPKPYNIIFLFMNSHCKFFFILP